MKFTRREFIVLPALATLAGKTAFTQQKSAKIDRAALVARHNPVLRDFEIMSPLSVGNGEFAFTCDATGLQTFPELYREKFPLCTMAQWGWHTTPRPANLVGKELKLTEYDTYGRKVGYHTRAGDQKDLFDWLRQNPHRLHLGQIGLVLRKADGSLAKPSDLSGIEQKLDLWTGAITSKFNFENAPVTVVTAAHPTRDVLSVSIFSPLIRQKKLAVKIEFPYGSPEMHAADWKSESKHSSILDDSGKAVYRKLDADEYTVGIANAAQTKLAKEKDHSFLFSSDADKLEFSLEFLNRARASAAKIPLPQATLAVASAHWKNFWMSGAAVDFGANGDKRAAELERRIVLSQYLTAVNCSGSLPPQETGLATNSWYGKYHLEMHWWHAAHFALWNRAPMLEKSLDWYLKVLPSARARAAQQGYKGVRWAKMTAEDGRDSPSPIGPLLIWQQPHPIFYAELIYLNKPTAQTLKKFLPIVEETANFMADFAYYDKQNDRYVLGPPVIPAQENHPAVETWNPTFELEYWLYGLYKANEWRARLGMKPNADWDKIAAKLSKLPVKDGVYLAHENCPQTYTERNIDHPSMLGALGILKGVKADRETMRRTLAKVFKEWNWDDTWGWDYPMTAMTATRLDDPEAAIKALLLDTPKNGYAKNGHNYQRPNLPLYLPGNGGLLYAVAMMANKGEAGFPADWKVKTEGFDEKIIGKI